MRELRDNQAIVDSSGVILKAVGLNEWPNADSPAVLINGLGSGVEPWGDFQWQLSEKSERPVVAVDLRQAVGRCAINPFLFPHMSDYGATLLQTLRRHDIDQPALVAFSNGTGVAAEASLIDPDAIDQLVLAGGTPGVQVFMPSLAAMSAFSQPDRKTALDTDFIKKVYGGELARRPELVEQLGIKREVDPVTYRQQLGAAVTSLYNVHNWLSLPLVTRLALNHKPTLIMAGDSDPITPYANAQIMHRLLPSSRLYSAQNDGHYFLLTNPEVSAEQISRFLDDTMSTAFDNQPLSA